jgi:nitrite reductase/ring-hydroxylating ferredoxin subunit
MAVKLAITLVLVAAIAAIAVGCTSGVTGEPKETSAPTKTSIPGKTSAPSVTNKLISPTWIGADVIQLDGNTMSIPVSEVTSGKMLHFGITDGQGDRMNFMAYSLNGETYARANLCPPCKSIGFSLLGDILVCDNCGTRFNATTGDGISGACVDYPKAEVAHAISDGKMAMQYNDLVIAYTNTGKPGWP